MEHDGIAICGMGLRFPGGCDTKEAFWELLCSSTPAIRPVPESRGWTSAEYVSAEGKVGHTVTERAGWIDDVDRFDPQAFKISPKEAAEMDPQQRLVLECSYEALLDAYINPATLAGSNTGVYVGAGIAEYMAMAFSDPDNMTSHTMSGNSLAVIANRVSNIWDLRGPSLTTDTACSSAMTAFHLGCQALKTGDCDLAIVAGVNTLLGPSPFIGFTQAQMLSPTGTSRPFDEAANGFVRGEGCGVLILRRSADISPNHPGRVYAYVRAHGINEDGKTMSLTMPSEEAQHDLMANTIRSSKTDPEDVIFVEAHGTGTKVGDPIEANSISRSTVGNRSSPLAIGSAKGHVGHLETAAGAVGLVKAALMLYNNRMPPTAGFSSFPKSINAEALKLRVPITVEPLPQTESGRAPCISINSYGFGGSNGYAILSQAKQPETKAVTSTQPIVLALSSHFKEGVDKEEAMWKKTALPSSMLCAASAVATATRPHQRYRKVLVAEPGTDLSKAQTFSGERVGASPTVLFAFGGQGSQYPSMGTELYAQFACFKSAIDRLVAKYTEVSNIDLMKDHGFCLRDMTEESLASVMVTVPATVFVQCALAELLKGAGVQPAAAVGHSTGEIVAAYIAGCIDLDALVIVTHARASAQEAMQEGAMAAWAASAPEAEAVIEQLGLQGKVCVSCHNTPAGVTLSGEKDAIEQMVEHGKANSVRCTVLPISRAYHSHHVEPVKDKFLGMTRGVQCSAPSKCPLLSSTMGKRLHTATDPEYWFGNMRGAVLFDKACTAVRSLAAQGIEPKIVLEVSPHAVLMPYLNDNLKALQYVPCLNKKRPGATHMLTALATLFASGVEVDWAHVLKPILNLASQVGELNIPKPTWQHKDAIRSVTWRNPYTHPQAKGAAPAAIAHAPVAAVATTAASGSNSMLITPSKQGYLRDHIVDGECVLPGAFYVCASLHRGPMLQACGFHRYLSLQEKFMIEGASGGVPLNFNSDGPRLTLCSNGDAEANEHFSCVLPRFPPKAPLTVFSGTLAELRAKFAEEARAGGGDVNLSLAYTSLENFSGLKFGPAFRRINSLRISRNGCEAVATITPPDVDASSDDAARTIHPSVLDAAFQALAFLHGLDSDMFVPNAINQVFLVKPASGIREAVAHAVLRSESRDIVIGDVDIYDAASGEVVMEIRGLTLRRAPSAKSKAPKLYCTQLQPLGFKCNDTAEPQELDDLVAIIRQRLQSGRVVRILGLPGSNEPMLKLAGTLAVTDPKQTADCPLRNSQVVMVSLDSEIEGPAVLRAYDATCIPAHVWDILVCGNDGDLHGDARTVMAQTYLNEGGVLCGATCWVKFQKLQLPKADELKVDVIGDAAPMFPQQLLCPRTDAAYVIDCRGDVAQVSALLKEMVAAKSTAQLICLIPANDAKSGDNIAVQDRALALRGWCRCARNETGLGVMAIQVPFPITKDTAQEIIQLLARQLPDQEFTWTECGWHVPRMMPVSSTSNQVEDAPDVRLQVGRPGQLSSLQWHPLNADHEDVRADEVQVQVRAVSMHFKDVMLAMGMLGDFKPIIGMECAGTVTRVGKDVTNFKPGDQVMCLAMSTSVGEERSALFGTRCIAKERQTVLMPKRDDLSFAEAAGFLGVMATAWHALVKVARLEKDDTVLIHSTLGGVGQAALQIAKNMGCRIVGSAGNPDKRKTLLEMGCHMVMDSRNPSEFVEKVMEFTGGRGVDVVLNSLAGDGQAETLKCVAPCGRFVEIGKRDILMDKRVGLGALKENVTFFSVHLDLLDKTHPHKVRALIDECTAMLADGRLKPTPTQVFPAEQVVDAFKLMASGKHQGKIVIDIPIGFHPCTVDATNGQVRLPQTLFPAAGSVLVTGGTRGLGLELARWTADRGAMSLILLTGSGKVPAKSELLIKSIQAAHPGIKITTPSCDVRNYESVERVFREASPPITSVFHAANQYSAEDSTTLTNDNLMGATWDIKVQGVVNIEKATRATNSKLSAFVMFTSLAGLHGNKGQALYVAANAAMQKLAAEMRTTASPIPAIALDFPIVVGAGRLADVRNAAELQINTGRGFGVISFSKLETLLARIMACPISYPSHMTMDLPHNDSPQAWSGYHTLNKNLMMFEHLCPSLGELDEEEEGDAAAATGSTQSPEEIEKAVLAKIAFVLGAGTDDLEMDVPLPEMGVDSLAAVELANWGQSTYGATVSQTEFLSGLTPRGFLNRVLESASSAPATKTAKAPKPKKETPAPTPASPVPTPVVPVATPAPTAPTMPAPAPSRSAVVSTYEDPVDAPVRVAAMPVAGTTGGQFGETTVLLTETLNPRTLRGIVAAVKGERRAAPQVLVFRGTGESPHFCTGMDLKAATFGDDTMSEGLEEFARLHQALEDAKMPIIAVCHGATRGGGMLFPCHATITLAVTGATFGFPEIRQGGLPGVVSVAAKKRLNPTTCKRWMCTGDAYTAEQALTAGLVDFIGTPEEVDKELRRILSRFRSLDQELLTSCYMKCPAGNVDQALLAMGALDKRDRVREREPDALVSLQLDSATGVCVLELNDPSHCNAIDWAMADDLRRAIEKLKEMVQDTDENGNPLVRAIVFQGAGDHFCVGVNPYNFIRRTKALPVITSGQITYEIYRAFVGLRDIGCPVVAVVHGKVMGGGLAASLNADYRIAHADTMFNYGNLPRGVCPGLLLSHNLGMTVGHKNATDLYMNDVTCTAHEALSMGLVNEVYDTIDMAKAKGFEFAARLASFPVTGVRNTLSLMRPPIDELRLSRECMGIARCNKVGNAFSGQWKAPERRVGEEGSRFGEAPSKVKQVMAKPAATAAPCAAPLVPTNASNTPAPNYGAWPNWQEYLDRETAEVKQMVINPLKARPAGPTTVFLTGASGFLGAFIIRDLLTSGHRVSCLVRADDESIAMARLRGNMQDYGLWNPDYEMDIKVYCGDLVSDNFGLSTAQWDQIAAANTTFIHNGADVNFSCQVEELIPCNVKGTRTALRLAAQGGMYFCHVSSLSVFSLYHFVGDASQKRPDPRILINGYARSKWLAEQVAWVAGERGMAVTVVRPGRIMGDSQTGACNLKDWFARYLLTCVQMQRAWNVDHQTDMTQVDACSDLIVKSALDKFTNGGCYHAVSLENLHTIDITSYMVSQGYKMDPVDYNWWMDRVRSLATSAMQPLLNTFSALPVKETDGQLMRFSSDMEHRNGNGLAQLERMVLWMRQKGFLPTPQHAPGTLPLPPRPAPKATSIPVSVPAAATFAAPAMPKLQTIKVNEPPQASMVAMSAPVAAGAQNAGILAMEMYTPNHSVDQSKMEQHHGCPGKYTAGLLQEQIGFCGDDEDAVSMALTVVSRLMKRTGIPHDKIGRLEVGTESLLDRSKSIKTHLMTLFQEKGCYDIEGVDNYNACYGGTAAFLNTMGWLQSPSWDGRYGIVVCVDIADFADHQAFLNGASAVALLLGPDAPVVLERERATCMINSWDFYKPVGWKDAYPLMPDGKHSVDCYMACLDMCYRKLTERVYGGVGQGNLVEDNDFFVNHCTSTYLCKRAFKRVCENAYPKTDEVVEGIFGTVGPAGGMTIKLKEQQTLYENKAEPATWITKRVGSSYTASCYTNLYSLFATIGDGMVGRKVVVYSYGSGSASTMYRLRVDRLPTFDRDIFKRLDNRVKHEPDTYIDMITAYTAATYGRYDFKPKDWGGKQEDVFYLTMVDELGKRFYEQHVAA